MLFRKVLANDAIEQIVVGPLKAEHLASASRTRFKLVTVPLAILDDDGPDETQPRRTARAERSTR